METIGTQDLWSFLDGSAAAQTTQCTAVRKGEGHPVSNFLELAKKVAELQFRNRDHVLLFRGQDGDYLNKEHNTTLKPSLFRPATNKLPNETRLRRRFERLQQAEDLLAAEYDDAGLLGKERLRRHRLVRWSVLQHYEVCGTPLLDVTHSLRIAASFATHEAARRAYLFVIGIPNLSGGITASAEAGLQTVRLSSVCPPAAVRPHVQEGYLLGEYPEMTGFDQKALYFHYEIDFGRRLVAKFRFDPQTFWREDAFPLVSHAALYPTEDEDPLHRLAMRVKKALGPFDH